MNGIALGTIIIDSAYNIVEYNEPVQKLIPAIAKNAKCYKALLGKDEPCSFCPVIRKQDCVALPESDTESVLELALPGGDKQHVLSFLINDQKHQPSLNCLKYNLIGYCLNTPAACQASEDERDLDKALGIYNMQAFLRHARKLLDDNPYDSFNLIISDIKNFQQITATYGEEKAQALLRGVAQLTKECYSDGIVARYGVDQVVSIYKAPSLEKQVEIVQRFKAFLAQTEIPNVIIKFGIYEDVDLDKELGVQLVAEGVETASQLLFLKHKGCDIIQGFYYSKPLPTAEFEAKLLADDETDLKKTMKLVLADFTDSPPSDVLYSHMPGGFFSYEAFGDEKILASNSYLWEMFGFDNEADFMEHVHGSFKGIVSPEELDAVEESIAQQIKGHRREMDFVKYHIIRKDGSKLPVVDYGHLAHQEGKDIFYVFLYEEQD